MSFSEADRLAALAGLEILDTPAEREFDEITRLAAAALGVRSAAVSLIDDKRQWFKSRHGIPFAETSRDVAFCSHAVEARAMLIVPDATKDARFRSNPLVTAGGGIRFYAGVPLFESGGHCIGSLCVFDPVSRAGLTADQIAVLRDLAVLATDLIASRRVRRMGDIAAKVVAATSDAVLAADSDGRIVYWNAAAEQMFGRSQADAIGRGIDILTPSRFAAGHREGYKRAATGSAARLVGSSVELIGLRADGTEFPVELSLARWGDAQSVQGLAAIVRDITARKDLEHDRAQAQVLLDTVITNLPAMLFVKDAETREYLIVNRVGEEVIGRPAEELLGSTDSQLFPAFGASYEERDTAAIAADAPHVYESVFVRDDGREVHLRTTRRLIDGPQRPNQYLLGVSEDVTQMRRAEADVLHLAMNDTLTGLLNRASYTDRLHLLVQERKPFALLTVDLDRFKAVNDQFGHLVGDNVLAEAADRLRSLVREGDWIARIGGDEFVLALLGDDLRSRAEQVAGAIVATMSAPFATGRAVAYSGASVGVVLSPDDGETMAQLRENADLALYRAKHLGRSGACFFNAEMDADARDRRTLETDLRQAIEDGQIRLEYQPVIAARTGRVSSVEALARWTHPQRGPVRPDVFISIAEECGMIDALGAYLLRTACTDALSWPDHLRVAVNLSPLQFISGHLTETVCDILRSTGLTANRLQLEVTEGLVIRDVDRTFVQLEQLRGLGIQILIDDFGVGYSSLSYFQRFPFDKVKIDRSFVSDMATSRAACAIIQAVIGLGKRLDMGVVAEGVETEAQMKMLVAFGCSHLQGYLFGGSMPAETIRAFTSSYVLDRSAFASRVAQKHALANAGLRRRG